MNTSPDTLRIELLGGLRVHSGDLQLQHFQTQKTGALLAYLALHPGRRHPREELIDLLWPDAPLDAGRHRLSQALTWLRPHLEPPGVARGTVLQADRPAVVLASDTLQTDVSEFEAALRAVSQTDSVEARVQALQGAIVLYEGDLLPGYYDGWTLAARQRLLESFLGALHQIIAHHEEAQRPEAALEYARRAVAADPMSEEAHCDLIRLLNASGRPDAAMRQFRVLEQMLARELEETPSSEARSLAKQVHRDRGEAVRPPPASLAVPLPAPLTRFFGREDELQHVMAKVRSGGRLVTLIGPGGCGKTRIAVEVAHRLADDYRAAVWFVPLADIEDPARIATALAASLRLPHADASPLEQIIAALAPRPALLVLDNLEHLADAVATLIQRLLTSLPRLAVIGTSRQRMRLEGEAEVDVSPLPLPALSSTSISPEHLLTYAGVQLFVDRAQAVRPAFRVTPQNAASVGRLCVRLEGIPLAIELCAAWAQTLSLDEMQTRLDRRFELLVSRRADVATRHRTLHAAVEYSYMQLPPPLKRLFARLSVFRGGWTLAAAEAVCRDARAGSGRLDVLSAMTDLRERSLIRTEESAGEMRYQMLETLREYAAEQIPPPETARRRQAHAVSFLELAERADACLQGLDQALWLGRLEAEMENLRAALAWAAEAREVEIGLRLAGALGTFWDTRGYLREGQMWLDRLLVLPGAGRATRARALNTRGYLARNQGDSPTVDAVMQEALSLWRDLGDERGLATALQIHATRAYSREDCDEAQASLTESLRLARKIGAPALVARSLLNLGNIALEQSDWGRAWTLYTESLTLFRAQGAHNRAAYALNNLGLVARYRNDLAAAQSLLQESLAVCRELADRMGIAEALLNLGTIARLQADHAWACVALREAAQIAFEAGDQRILIWCIKETGHVACAMGDFALGIRLLSSAESLRATMGISFKPAGPNELAHDQDQARAVLGKTGLDAAWASGSALPLAQAQAALLSAMNNLEARQPF